LWPLYGRRIKQHKSYGSAWTIWKEKQNIELINNNIVKYMYVNVV
jgi:hypothetical protein